MGIFAHYQCKVKKESVIKAQQQPQQIVYNFNGANLRVNNTSDSSTNIVIINKENLFENLKESLEDPKKLELIISQDVVEDIGIQVDFHDRIVTYFGIGGKEHAYRKQID